jgi:hypothetical protein
LQRNRSLRALRVYILLRCHGGVDISGDPSCNAGGGGAPKSKQKASKKPVAVIVEPDASPRAHKGGAQDPTCKAGGVGAPNSEVPKKSEGPKKNAHKGGAQDPTCKAGGAGAPKSKQKAGKKKAAKSKKAKALKARRAGGKAR